MGQCDNAGERRDAERTIISGGAQVRVPMRRQHVIKEGKSLKHFREQVFILSGTRLLLVIFESQILRRLTEFRAVSPVSFSWSRFYILSSTVIPNCARDAALLCNMSAILRMVQGQFKPKLIEICCMDPQLTRFLVSRDPRFALRRCLAAPEVLQVLGRGQVVYFKSHSATLCMRSELPITSHRSNV